MINSSCIVCLGQVNLEESDQAKNNVLQLKGSSQTHDLLMPSGDPFIQQYCVITALATYIARESNLLSKMDTDLGILKIQLEYCIL